MADAIFTAPRFTDETAAREHLESLRWPNGAVCPHCGGTERNSKLTAKSKTGARPGLYFCGDCRSQFSVTVGTVFERSKVALHKWVLATHLICSSKKGMSAHQLHRTLGVTYKTAWFMAHRIREAMKPDGVGFLGGHGQTVEVDETYWGSDPTRKEIQLRKPKGGSTHKMKIVSLVERGGNARSFHVPRVNAKTLKPILISQIGMKAKLMTDEAKVYKTMKKEFASHETVNHSVGEYVRGNVHTNTVEGYFSILKRGLIGTFHHVGEQHLQRYVNEFDFRYNHRKVSDTERAAAALKGISGKRLTYQLTAHNI